VHDGVLAAVDDESSAGAQPLDRGAVGSRSRPVDAQSGRRREFEDRGAHPAGRAMHEQSLPAFRFRCAVKHLVRGHVDEDEAQDLGRVEVVGHLDRVVLRNADTFGVGAPLRQCADAGSHVKPRAAGAELIDMADEFVAGRERRLRAAEIRARTHLGIAE
jgi:hypothetical protein